MLSLSAGSNGFDRTIDPRKPRMPRSPARLRCRAKSWLGWLSCCAGLSLGCQSLPRSDFHSSSQPVHTTWSLVNHWTQARAETPQQRWDAWATEHLETGDIVFIRTEIPVLGGLIDLGNVVTQLQNGPYSHTGILVQTDSGPMICDMHRTQGPRQVRFSEYVGHFGRSVGIKRLKPHPQRDEIIAAAVEFCAEAQRQHTPFDKRFALGDEAFYCVELTVVAFREAGLELVEPIAASELPGYASFSESQLRLARLSPLGENPQIYVPGNDSVGLWASPWLETIAAADNPHALLSLTPLAEASPHH